jgi:hypothetical protein
MVDGFWKAAWHTTQRRYTRVVNVERARGRFNGAGRQETIDWLFVVVRHGNEMGESSVIFEKVQWMNCPGRAMRRCRGAGGDILWLAGCEDDGGGCRCAYVRGVALANNSSGPATGGFKVVLALYCSS